MAYDQGYYQPPSRQQYNGRATQRSGPPQGYGPAPQQQYAQQGYEQYPQDGYGYEGYDNGFAQDYGTGGYQDVSGGRGNGGYQDWNAGRGNGAYQDSNAGRGNGAYQDPNAGRGNGGYQDVNGRGRGSAYRPHNQNYPPHQEYYGDQRGGGAIPPPNRGRGIPGPQQRPPTSDGYRGGPDQRGDGQGRGYQSGPPPQARGRPAPLERSTSSDPGMQGQTKPPSQPRKPLISPKFSPEAPSFDNPFGAFPGAKKKTSISEEQKITRQMAKMDVGASPQGRPRTAGSKSSQDRHGRGGGQTDDYGRPSIESQRSLPPRDYNSRGPSRGPPQQSYPDQRQEPTPPGRGHDAPPLQNGYDDAGFNDRGAYGAAAPARGGSGPPARSMTMPNEPPVMPNGRQPPKPAADERPYNGPVGRPMPPRPATAGGTRPPPQRTYPAPDPVQQPPQQYTEDQYSKHSPKKPTHRAEESISDFYDHYYDPPDPTPQRNGRTQSDEPAMPSFDDASHRRGASIDGHMQNGPAARSASFDQPRHHLQDARAQPQAAVFEMAAEMPPMPNIYPKQGYDANGQNNGQQSRGPQRAQGSEDYNQGPDQGQYPPRSASATPRTNGLPSGPKPDYGAPGGPQNGPPRSAPPSEALPVHPPPVRAGLMSGPGQLNAKPPPVRNYNNISPGQQTPPSQPQSRSSQPQSAGQSAPDGAPVVTAQELEKLRNDTRTNPNDQETAMILARKLIEACDVLVPAIPDQRARGKTRERYILDAHKILKKLVGWQNTEAMFYLADCYGRGALGLEADNKEAFSLYQSAAKAGHAAAAYRTAVCCELGQEEGGGTRKDPLKAIQWYKRAATLGDTPAMYKMGMILLKGLLGQPKNPREAVGWLKRAAERADAENPHALHELGLLYEAPQGPDGSILRDEAYSFSLFKQAAELGYKFSQFRMGCAFEYGLFNCPIDPRQSIMWYSRAAVQEEHQSELALSGWYLTGSEGILQQSDTEAYLWARKAAMAGQAKAEYAMGYFTEVGIGSPASLEDAKRWYWRAAAQNFPKARERLEDLKKGGAKAGLKSRERISRSKVGKQNEGECAVM